MTHRDEELTVSVKPLEWKDISDGRECYQAIPPVGPFYWIEDDGFSEKKYGVRAHQLLIGCFDDLSAAKDAAQVDFALRILSAIITEAGR